MANTDWVTLSPRTWVNPEEGWRYDRGCINPSGHVGSWQVLQCADKIACTGRFKELISLPHKASSPSELRWSPRPDITQQALLYKSLLRAWKLWFLHTVQVCYYHFQLFCPGMPFPLSPHCCHCFADDEIEAHSKSHLAGKCWNRTRIQV